MRSLLLCLTVLAGAAILAPGSTAQAAPIAHGFSPSLAAVTATDGALVETVQYYREDRRNYRADRREWRRREEARRRAEWRRRHGRY